VPPRSRADKRSAELRQAEVSGPPQLSVTPALFREFQQLIYSETGIWLGASKTALLTGRLFRRLLNLNIPSLKEYYELVAAPDGLEERARMIDAITTNETRFFREPRQFDFLVQEVFPRWKSEAEKSLRSKRVRIWSAGCSSGEEPYTLAMLLAQNLPSEEGWDTRVLATDISNRVLEKARRGIYDSARAEGISRDLLRKFMLKGVADQEGRVKVKVSIQEMIDFARLNLNVGPYPVQGPFDAILCRNVLIYFSPDSRKRAVANLVSQLAANGFLFVGHAENLSSLSTQLRSIEPTIYVRTTSTTEQSGSPRESSSPTGADQEGQKTIATSAGK
jgi:chemotaxis protein methyltransferase CheR